MNIFKLFILLIGTAPYSQYTLSTVGSPCPWNHTDFSCAICTAGIYLLIYFIFDYFNSSNFFSKMLMSVLHMQNHQKLDLKTLSNTAENIPNLGIIDVGEQVSIIHI